MEELIVIGGAALLTSLLTFFSGFGVGTILTPVFMIFFPLDAAIALTGIVHLLNNIFKISLLGNKANWKIALKFGLPAIIAALGGAAVLVYFANANPLYTYELWGHTCEVSTFKIIIAVLMFVFALYDQIPSLRDSKFASNNIILGGIISGFFGGLSGHQGALRSAFLMRVGLSKEAFLATGIVIACVVDVGRISVYLTRLTSVNIMENLDVLCTAIGAAFVGAVAGKLLLKKVTYGLIQWTVTVMLILLSVLLGIGFI